MGRAWAGTCTRTCVGSRVDIREVTVHTGSGSIPWLNVRTDLFDFELPEHLIALAPAHPRDSAKLLVVRNIPSPRSALQRVRGEGQGEGQPHGATPVAAPLPDPLPAREHERGEGEL